MHPEAGINISQDISMSKLKMNKEYLNDDELDKTQNGYGDYNDLNNNAQDNSQQLSTLILKQLEFYFSRENLLNDKYLQSQMDSDNYVPICVLITFNMMKKIFSNSNLAHSLDDERIKYVQNVIKQTNNSLLQLDPSQTKIRANHKRCVVILREIDKDTPLEQIESLFSTCKVKCLNYEFAGSSSWYLTFKDESEAQIAVQFIKEEVRTFNNQPLFARIKTSPIPRLNSTNTEFNNNNNNNNESLKHLNYSQYQPYYYSDMSQIVNPNPWMIYPNFSTNYNKLKQTTTDTTSNLSSSSANYIINPFDPYMLSYNGAHHQYKNNQQQQQRRNYYRLIKDNDLNQTSQNETTFNNQNFIIFPTQASFVYPNDFVYPIPFAVNQSLTQIASSSSASSSSSTKQNNYQKKNTTKRYQATPNPNNNNNNNKINNNSDNFDSYKKNKYSRPNGNKISNGYNRKSRTSNNGFNNNNRKNESDLSLVQFDYEPTSFPPLKDGEIKSEIIEPELDLENNNNNNDVELNSDTSPWSAYSRRSFAEIVKHKQLNGLVDELNKVKIAEE